MKSRAILAFSLAAALFGGYLASLPQSGRPAAGRATAIPVASPAADPAAATASRAAATVPPPGSGAGRLPPSDRAPGCVIEPRYLPHADGTAVTVYACVGDEPAPVHPYATYPNEALASLAYGDARAAEVLGMRLRHEDPVRAISLAVRAAALSGGDPGPILALSNAWPGPTEIDGVLVRRTVHTKFVLSAVAELLGAESNNLPYWKDTIRRASTDPEREIELLLEHASDIVETMRRIEQDVTGRSTIGGQRHG